MNSLYSRAIKYIINFNRITKTFLLMLFDYLMLTFSFWASLSIRSNSIFVPTEETMILVILAPLLSLPIFFSFGLYFSMTRYSGYQSIKIIILGVSIYTMLWFLLILSIGIIDQPYDFLIINWLLSICLFGASRIIIRWLLQSTEGIVKKVLIYGAGSAGIQLKSAIEYNPNYRVIGFLDDDSNVQGLSIENIKVHDPKKLEKFINKKGVSQILIAMPSIKNAEKYKLFRSLKEYSIEIKSLPDINDIVEGRISVNDLKKIKITDLLGRAPREPDHDLISKDISGKSILVIGAGGSIGSQISREILKNNPKMLVIMDINEFSLYSIEKEFMSLGIKIPIFPILGSVVNQKFLRRVIKNYQINTVYHAAAYKHVPMVEKNITSAIEVNIFGTLSAIEASKDTSVESFVFISTDKAVRPTNIMGSTKRFAEMILQSYSKKLNKAGNKLRISMVRFGNVLGSSGSVVPLFEDQIKKGGPITVTDPNIIRYFMTIEEASQLVIQSGALGQSGEVFVLDMGKQIKIKQLAEDMIKLSGMTLKSEKNPDGDIEIVYTGLRPGEKLYEELFLEDEFSKTIHPQIFRADESSVVLDDLLQDLDLLKSALANFNSSEIMKILSRRITGFNHNREIIDGTLSS